MGPLSILPSEVAEQYRPSAGQTLDVQGDGDPFARTERWPVRSARQHHLRGGRDPESHDLARPGRISSLTQIGGGESHDIHSSPTPTIKKKKKKENLVTVQGEHLYFVSFFGVITIYGASGSSHCSAYEKRKKNKYIDTHLL